MKMKKRKTLTKEEADSLFKAGGTKVITKYKIVFDSGKPYEVFCCSDEALKKELRNFYDYNKDSDYQFDAKVYNENNEEITESQFIEEMIGEIIE